MPASRYTRSRVRRDSGLRGKRSGADPQPTVGTAQAGGELPVGPFLHQDPTAIGLVELDRPLAVATPSSTPDAAQRPDALLLVRLHDDPLSLIHIAEPFGELGREQLAERVWSGVGERLRGHVRRHSCAIEPRSGKDLVGGLVSPYGTCGAAVPSRPAVSSTVLVPTAGRPNELARCLDSLLELPRSDFDIVVVDNRPSQGDTANVVASARDAGGRVRYVAEPRPGSSVARNRGIAESDSDVVVFADDDVVVDRGWLDWLLSPFADPAVTVTTGLVLPLDLETPAQKCFERYLGGFAKGLVGRRYDLDSYRGDDHPLYPYWGAVFGTGASVAFRRHDLVAAGGFDPALGAGSPALAGADIEAMSAAILRGGGLVYEPRSLCWHEHRRSEEALRYQLFSYGVGSTALLTKALLHDRRFLGAAAHSAGVVRDLYRARERDHQVSAADSLLAELAREQLKGMVQGPWRYARSVRWARRLGLHATIQGR